MKRSDLKVSSTELREEIMAKIKEEGAHRNLVMVKRDSSRGERDIAYLKEWWKTHRNK